MRERKHMKACKDFKPFVTNKDICAYWLHPDPDAPFDDQFFPLCEKGLACPTYGQRPERLDQESDSDE